MSNLLLLLLGLVIFASSQAHAVIPETVKIDSGQLQGTVQEGVRVFKGVPFAAPPVGPLRWREPQPVAKWEGVRKADKYGNACMQNNAKQRFPVNSAVDLPDSPGMSEDCLYLNVWTNANNASAKLPVMFWIYGGAYTEGAGHMPAQDGVTLAKKGAVVVTFNYRLGPFGFYSHPELDAESGHNASGNQAMLDTIAALKWVQANIANFGGDPKNVTVFGESAGAVMSAVVGRLAARQGTDQPCDLGERRLLRPVRGAHADATADLQPGTARWRGSSGWWWRRWGSRRW